MRRRVDWLFVLNKNGTDEMFLYFFYLLSKLHGGKHISSNRAAYSTLKHYYSTTTISELCRKLGI